MVLLTFLIAAFVVLVALNIARIQQQDAAAGQAGTSTAPAAPDTVRPHARPVVTVLGGATGDGFGVLPAKSLLSPELAGDITVRPTKGARYVQGAGTSGSTFESLARTAIPGSAAVVLYSGQHDRGDPLPALASAATRAVAAAKARCPGAAVVLVGPVWRPDEQPPEDIQILRSTLRSVATAAKAQWVDPIGQHWIPNRPGMVDSQGDLTSAARQALAAALGKAVAPHLG